MKSEDAPPTPPSIPSPRRIGMQAQAGGGTLTVQLHKSYRSEDLYHLYPLTMCERTTPLRRETGGAGCPAYLAGFTMCERTTLLQRSIAAGG